MVELRTSVSLANARQPEELGRHFLAIFCSSPCENPDCLFCSSTRSARTLQNGCHFSASLKAIQRETIPHSRDLSPKHDDMIPTKSQVDCASQEFVRCQSLELHGLGYRRRP
ncbi:hypothetical protein PGT21_028633 [Puccinia graminis f. sp. tritici]|uniref:Uncharacterized protein n=1 Tax=Puccinia graminis f. sp. tritici TaxID=56615 RepID=A0A5B0PJA0_PUCGR|nr:hypothetical protein PGT21_029356 [Puccinia graminis f. sp. tritici]KAA1101727.1 hypothetical protein PGT21_028633 [Puccinia graminis f. sp. tritici]